MRAAQIVILGGLASAVLASSHMAQASDIPCPTAAARESATSLPQAEKSWVTLARHFHRFAACDDGELAEGYSQAVVELLSRHWDRLPELTRLARRDGKLRTWVLRHIDASASGDDLKAIVQNTARCPASTTALCADVRAAAEHALKELEGVDSSE